MKYSKAFLKTKTKKELIDIIIKADITPIRLIEKIDNAHRTILDGTVGMRRGE